MSDEANTELGKILKAATRVANTPFDPKSNPPMWAAIIVLSLALIDAGVIEKKLAALPPAGESGGE